MQNIAINAVESSWRTRDTRNTTQYNRLKKAGKLRNNIAFYRKIREKKKISIRNICGRAEDTQKRWNVYRCIDRLL